jgi:hypothetical protein
MSDNYNDAADFFRRLANEQEEAKDPFKKFVLVEHTGENPLLYSDKNLLVLTPNGFFTAVYTATRKWISTKPVNDIYYNREFPIVTKWFEIIEEKPPSKFYTNEFFRNLENEIADEKKLDTFDYHRKQKLVEGLAQAAQSIAKLSAMINEFGIQIRLCQIFIDEVNEKMKELKESTQ